MDRDPNYFYYFAKRKTIAHNRGTLMENNPKKGEEMADERLLQDYGDISLSSLSFDTKQRETIRRRNVGILSRGKEQSLGGENSRDPAVSRAVPRDVHRAIIILIRKWREPNASAVQMVGRDRGRTFWRLPVPSLILGRGPSRRLNEQTEFETPCTGQAGYIYLHHGNTTVHDECFS